MNLSTTIGGLKLKGCIYNASGVRCTTRDELDTLHKSPYVAAVLTKSSTLEPREGNPHPRYYYDELTHTSINSTGLANLGYKFYSNLIPQYTTKPYIISIAGLTPDANLKMLEEFTNSPPDAIELNISCPNIVGKPQLGYNFGGLEELLRGVKECYDWRLGLKLPPYFDIVHVGLVADIINEFKPGFVVCSNSLGNGLMVDVGSETIAIASRQGLGGIGGVAMKPIACSNVWMMRKNLHSSIDIVGCGGVVSGGDVFELMLAGASAVQVGTTFIEEGIGCFERLSVELTKLMKKKNYAHLTDFKGRLKIIK